MQQLLRVLAAGRRCAEAGTAYGDGAAAIAETARSLVTVELDPERAAVARGRLEPLENVEALEGDWRELLPPLGPFELFFMDGGGFKQAPDELPVDLVAPDGLLVLDDFTPGRPVEGDPARTFLARHPRLVVSEVQVAPDMSMIVAVRR